MFNITYIEGWEVLNGETFLGKEVVSLSVALSFMQATLNAQLKSIGIDVHKMFILCSLNVRRKLDII